MNEQNYDQCCDKLIDLYGELVCNGCGRVFGWIETYSAPMWSDSYTIRKNTVYDPMKHYKSLVKKILSGKYNATATALVTPNEHTICMEAFRFIRKEIPKNERPWSYPYIIHKLFDLYVADKNVLQLISLKSTANLKKSDRQWAKICDKLQMEYRPTH